MFSAIKRASCQHPYLRRIAACSSSSSSWCGLISEARRDVQTSAARKSSNWTVERHVTWPAEVPPSRADPCCGWSARRRRRPNVGVAPAPFLWRVHVTLYTSYMLLDSVMPFTINLEHWQKAERTTRVCFAIALDTQMKHSGVRAKVFLWTILWKWKLMLNVVWNFLANLVNTADGTVKDFNSVYCNNCL